MASILGKLPTPAEYMEYAGKIDSMAPEIYRYMNFDQMPDFVASAERGRQVAVEMSL